MSELITLATRIVFAVLLIFVASIAFFSQTVLADCTCNDYGQCAARAPGDWAPTSYDYGSNRIVFYIDSSLSRGEESLIALGISRWHWAMSANGLSYHIRSTTTRGSHHGIHELTIGFIKGNDGSILGVTDNRGIHHRHVIIDRPFWYYSNDAVRVAVIAHEIGHVLGLGHSPYHADLMHDHYNPQNMYPTTRDLARATSLLRESVQRRYAH